MENTVSKNKEEISCPTCNQSNTWQPDNKFKPFCSDRCKLIDLGEWANESRTVPLEPNDSDWS